MKNGKTFDSTGRLPLGISLRHPVLITYQDKVCVCVCVF